MVHRAWARPTPTLPASTLCTTVSVSFSANVSRLFTQDGFLPHTAAIVFGPSLSSWRNE